VSGEAVSHTVLADSMVMPAGLGEREEGRVASSGEGR